MTSRSTISVLSRDRLLCSSNPLILYILSSPNPQELIEPLNVFKVQAVPVILHSVPDIRKRPRDDIKHSGQASVDEGSVVIQY